MERTAEAISHGAITVVNAIATGMGAALGVSLWTKAKVMVTDNPGNFECHNLTEPDEDTTLMKTAARLTFRKYAADKKCGAIVQTTSNIPIAVGLKSSSAASNAVTLASTCALGRRTNDARAVKLGVDSSLKAGVTLTGAYDDACACYFGGLIVTNNFRRRILRRFRPERNLRVLIHVPNKKSYTKDVDRRALKSIKQVVQAAHAEALRGRYWISLTLNGFAYSSALGYDASVAREALRAGAVAAGLSGKGPATSAIVPDKKVEDVLAAWNSFDGRIIETSFNYKKARAVRLQS
jgi:shikimate kinase